MDIFSIFFNMKAILPLHCINIKKKILLNYPKHNNVCIYFSLGLKNEFEKAISVRATEVLLLMFNAFHIQ